MKRLTLLLTLLIGSHFSMADSGIGADIELICPCTASSASSSSIEMGFGVINRSEDPTGVLTVEVYVHTEESYRDAASPQLIASTAIATILAADTSIASSNRQLPLDAPTPGDYYITTVLLEDSVVVDESRSDEAVTFVDDLAAVNDSNLYFVADPSITIGGATLTLTLPGVGNNSQEDIFVQVEVIATDTPRLVSMYQVIASLPGDIAIESSQQSDPQVEALAFTDPGAGFPFYHVLAFTDDGDQLVHTVQSSETFNTLTFSESNIDYLMDTDGDGVADASERLEGTDPNSAASVPADSVIDILAVYNADVAALYGGDPTTRIDDVIAVANQALTDSNVAMSLRVVDTVQRGYSSATSQSTLLNQAENSLGVFSDLQTLRDNAGADLVVIYLADDEAGTCSTATQGGYPTQGHLARRDHISISVLDAADCDDVSTMHGIGHNMGLNHSFDNNASGTFVWSRGFGINTTFATIMTEPSQFDLDERVPYFSNPDITDCSVDMDPCGVEIGELKQADAAASLNLTRFQVANFSDAAAVIPDPDPDPDPGPEPDNDGDGIPDEEDPDDDNDGMPDVFELANELDPLVDDSLEDPDEDGFTNIQEYNRGSDPQVPDPMDACDDPAIDAPNADDSLLEFEKRLQMVNPGSNTQRQSFIRLINAQPTATNVEIYGIDDNGEASRNSPITLTLSPESALQLTAQDLENGNVSKGLENNLCDLEGKWQLRIRSDQTIDVMGLIRSTDGFLTGMSEVAPSSGAVHNVYFANPARNTNQQSFIRVINQTVDAGSITISGIDDDGNASNDSVSFTLNGNSALQLTSQDLESGNAAKGLSGSLGTGSGKWRLNVSSDTEIAVMSLLRAPGGLLTNLSSATPKDNGNEARVYFVSPADAEGSETFIRVINTSNSVNNITISAIDDTSAPAPNGNIQLTLDPGASRQMTSADLEQGNINKGLSGFLGDGTGRWQLEVNADQSIEVMSLTRTTDGFVTNMSGVVDTSAQQSSVLFMNPGSNTNQLSSLRIINVSGVQASVTITAVDDTGDSAPGGNVTFNLQSGEARNVTAAELEAGGSGLSGALDDGIGKWRVTVSSNVNLVVQSLLEAPGGYQTNLSEPVQ